MPTWVEGPHYSTRAKFVAQVVRKFGSFCTGTSFREVKCTLVPWEVHVGETEVTKWNEATGKCSANVIEKLNALGVKTVDDANAGMYTCIVALSQLGGAWTCCFVEAWLGGRGQKTVRTGYAELD